MQIRSGRERSMCKIFVKHLSAPRELLASSTRSRRALPRKYVSSWLRCRGRRNYRHLNTEAVQSANQRPRELLGVTSVGVVCSEIAIGLLIWRSRCKRRQETEDAVLVEVTIRGTHLGGSRGAPLDSMFQSSTQTRAWVR